MAYCILRVEKAKTKAQLQRMYEHQYREKMPDNADPNLSKNNDIAFPVQGNNFVDAFNKRISQLPYYQNHEIRKNGVLAYDIVFEYSKDAANTIDKEAWKKDNIKWLEQEFGKENILGVVYHYDEASYTEQGVIHGHAVVVPIDENGKLNASRYTGTKAHYVHLQDSYADIMKAHNLERGLSNSAALHTDVKRFYAKLTNAIYGVPLPEKEPTESWESYSNKLKESWKTERAAHVRELEEKNREITEIRSGYNTDKTKEFRIRELEKTLDVIKSRDDELVREFGSIENTRQLASAMQSVNEFIQEYPDDEIANKMSDDLLRAIEWAEARRDKKRAAEKKIEKEEISEDETHN